MTLRVVSYAINGRGLGHLVRQLAVLRWVRRLGATLGLKVEPWLLTSSEADTLARREGIPALKLPSKSMLRDAGLDPARSLAVARGWVLSAVAGLQPDVLVVDTFPGGSFGELGAVLELARRRVLVARTARSETTADPAWAGWLPLYDRVLVPGDGQPADLAPFRGRPVTALDAPILLREAEELLSPAEARRALGVPDGRRACWLSVGGGGDVAAGRLLPRLGRAVSARGWHVIVAAGPLYEGEELRGPGFTWLERYASVELLRGADAAITAGGYNSAWELALAGVPAVFLPQPRLSDDQAARARRLVEVGGGVLAPSAEAAPALLDTLGPPGAPRVENAARHAAAAVLSLVHDPADVAAALQSWSGGTLASLSRCGLTAEQAVPLLRLLGAEPPGERARLRAAAQLFADRGLPPPPLPPARAAAPAERWITLCATLGVAAPRALPTLVELARRFPAAGPVELCDAADLLWPRFAAWDDWMGSHALVRALPVSRDLRLGAFTPRFAAWLARHEDPYQAQRALHAALAEGRRTLGEALGLDREPAVADTPGLGEEP